MATISVTYNNYISDIYYSDNNTLSLFVILKDNGYILNSPCGGNGYCNKCNVIINNSKVKACSYIPHGDISVTIPHTSIFVSPISYSYNEKIHKNISSVTGKKQPFYVAIDIGSTSISIALTLSEINKASDSYIIDTHSFPNPSVIYGADIISRAQASVNGKRDTIANLLVSSLESETLYLIRKNNIDITFLNSIYIACNTTMQHLLLSLDCSGILNYPFNPVSFRHTLTYKGYPVIIIPSFCTFVGGDIVSGLYYLSPVPYKKYLLIDIGTNAEIVLVTENKKYCTSAAAGPAFEGVSISCGTAYTNGAINKVSIMPSSNSSYKVNYETINNKLPCGICGSGILDIYAQMISLGIIDENKTLNNNYIDTGFKITNSLNGPLYINQNDIRQIQVAISAIRTGITILLSNAKINESELEHIYISGSFASSSSPSTLITAGLLPSFLLNHNIISFVGNTSLLGAAKASANNCTADSFNNLISSYIEIELANDPLFNDIFLKYM